MCGKVYWVEFFFQIVDGDLLSESIKFARSVAGNSLQPLRLSALPVKGKEMLIPKFEGIYLVYVPFQLITLHNYLSTWCEEKK
jgi:hypothetical protein